MADKKQPKPKAQAEQLELPGGIKFEPVNQEAVNQLKLKTRKGPPISETAQQMYKPMLANVGSGSKVALSSKALQDGKDQIKRVLVRDLQKLARHAGQKQLSVRCIENGDELTFYFEQRREVSKRKETPAAA